MECRSSFELPLKVYQHCYITYYYSTVHVNPSLIPSLFATWPCSRYSSWSSPSNHEPLPALPVPGKLALSRHRSALAPPSSPWFSNQNNERIVSGTLAALTLPKITASSSTVESKLQTNYCLTQPVSYKHTPHHEAVIVFILEFPLQ